MPHDAVQCRECTTPRTGGLAGGARPGSTHGSGHSPAGHCVPKLRRYALTGKRVSSNNPAVLTLLHSVNTLYTYLVSCSCMELEFGSCCSLPAPHHIHVVQTHYSYGIYRWCLLLCSARILTLHHTKEAVLPWLASNRPDMAIRVCASYTSWE